MKSEHCKIEVPIPEGADLKKIESAVKEALKTKLTDATVKDYKEITIVIKHGKGTE
jgi:hypothetical protein